MDPRLFLQLLFDGPDPATVSTEEWQAWEDTTVAAWKAVPSGPVSPDERERQAQWLDGMGLHGRAASRRAHGSRN